MCGKEFDFRLKYFEEFQVLEKLVEDLENSGVFSGKGDWILVKGLPLAYRVGTTYKWCLSIGFYESLDDPNKDIHFSVIRNDDPDGEGRFGGRLVTSLPYRHRDSPEFLQNFLTTIKLWES